jgi:hypothetical protein
MKVRTTASMGVASADSHCFSSMITARSTSRASWPATTKSIRLAVWGMGSSMLIPESSGISASSSTSPMWVSDWCHERCSEAPTPYPNTF